MKINLATTNRILLCLAIIILLAAGIAYPLLNEAQQYVITAGGALGLLNLLGLYYFFNKNKPRSRRR